MLSDYQCKSIFDLLQWAIKSSWDEFPHEEVSMGVVISPFDAIPFKSGVAISPLSLRPKGSDDRRIVMDCSWPIGSLLNYSIDTDSYMGQKN